MAQAGDRIGAYVVVRLIAHGGMATVYEARQPALDRAVALKRLDLRSDDPTLADRFIRESRIAASFDHPNIVTVYDFLDCDGVPYIAMEYLPRGSLRPFVGGLSHPQAFGVLEGVLAALAHAEQRGVAHRDLKPENVLVTGGGAVKIADFGIAKAYTQTTGNLTAAGVAVGTPVYMAPEQALAQQVGPFTDLYAAGVMAYELLGGTPPFAGGDSPMSIMYRHVSEPPPPLRGVDPRLAAWVARMLEKRPAARPPGAAIAWAELEEVVVDIHGPYWRRDAALGVEPAAGEAGADPPTAPAGASAAGRTGVDPMTAPPAPVGTTRPRIATAIRPAPPAHPGRRRRMLVGAAVVFGLAAAGAAAVALDDEAPVPDRAAATPTPTAEPEPPDGAAPFDFDGDGRAQAAVGLPDAGRRGAGVVALPPGERRIVAPTARTALDFGAAVASADFDGDGMADLAIGAPGANRGDPSQREGAVYVVSGGPAGLSDDKPAAYPWPKDGRAYSSARFGAALAAGDLNADGYADLAVGVPGSDVRLDERGSGSVRILRGGPEGLARSRRIARPGGAVGFGGVLAIADVNGDRRLDLLEGAPGGHAAFCPGAKSWPSRCRLLAGGSPGPAAIAAGDVTGDGIADVVHGVPDAGEAGALRIWQGRRRRVPSAPPLEITQESPEILGNDQPGDGLGAAVAVAQIDGDRYADIVVSEPGEQFDRGRIHLLFGDGDGTDELRDLGYSQDQGGSLGLVEAGDRLGASLALLDVVGDRRLDLALAAPGAGRLFVLRGTAGGFDGRGASLQSLPVGDARLGGP